MLDRAASLFLVGFSALIFFGSVKLGIGTLQEPQSGFFPGLAAVVVFSLSVWLLVASGLKRIKEGKRPSPGLEEWKKPAALLAALCAFSFLLDFVGYLISSFLLMFAMFMSTQPRKWYLHLVSAALIAGLSFLIFNKLLGLEFPAGSLFELD